MIQFYQVPIMNEYILKYRKNEDMLIFSHLGTKIKT